MPADLPPALHTASLAELKALFATLPDPAPEQRRGFFRARFIGPAFIRLSARPTLEITGLPGWQGKKFLGADAATNILRRGTDTVERLAMRVTPVTSYADGRAGLALTYPPQGGRAAPAPWRWVRDEIRQLDAQNILAFTYVDLPLLRHIGFPFLLTRED